MNKSLDTDPGLTVVGQIFQDALVGDNVSSSFVTPVAANFARYDISAPEAGGANASGHYVLPIPSWLPQGLFSLTFINASDRSKLGVVTVDTRSPSSLTVSPSTALSALISSLRILANDTSTSNYIDSEGPKNKPDGAQLNFKLANRNLVSGSVFATYASNFRIQTGFTVDTVNGIVTFVSAPSDKSLYFDYCFNWFADADYTEFLTEGARTLSLTDPGTVVAGLAPSLIQFGLYAFYNRRATAYAPRYNSSGAQAGQQVESVTKNYTTLAKAAYDRGVTLRDDYYQRQGQQKEPASSIVNYRFDPFTPPR